jgi:hypothetical protein
MSIFQLAMDRLADFIWTGRKVNLRFTAEYRTACFAAPLIAKMLAEDADGHAYRSAIVPWHRSERPPLEIYQGHMSFCRIDGPLQWVGDKSFAMGGLILSPGVTAHLNPFEAEELRDHMQQAIESAIVAWVRDHDLYTRPPAPVKFDRGRADRNAKAMIATWAENEMAKEDASLSPENGCRCCADPIANAPCDACRKGSDHG